MMSPRPFRFYFKHWAEPSYLYYYNFIINIGKPSNKGDSQEVFRNNAFMGRLIKAENGRHWSWIPTENRYWNKINLYGYRRI